MKQQIFLPFGEWRPDLSSIENPGTPDILNVIPDSTSFRPFSDLSVFSGALTARCQGAFAAKDQSANAQNFAGDGTKLYKLSSDLTWADVSRTTGGAYATDTAEFWEFGQFGANIIAVNGTDDTQVFTLGSSTNFAPLATACPTAKHIAIVRDFVVLGNTSTDNQGLQWSGFNNSAAWTVGVNQSDTQSFPDGGVVQAIVGGEVGYIIQERSIRRMTYVGGDVIFQFDQVESARGTRAPKSVVQVGPTFFYYGVDGFYWFTGGGSQPIGSEKVDRWFRSFADESYLYRMIGTADPRRRMVEWAFTSTSSLDGNPDYIIGYKWDIGQFFLAKKTTEYIYQATQQGYTLEGLDTVSSSIDALNISLDSAVWAGGALSLGGFDTNHKVGYFDGTPLAASITTAEKNLILGRRSIVSSAYPVTDTTDATVTLGMRERFADSVTWSSAVSMETTGACPVRASGRFAQVKIDIPAGSTWTHIQGVMLDARAAGVRS